MEGRNDLAPQTTDEASVREELHALLDEIIKQKSSATSSIFFPTVKKAFEELKQKELLDFNNARRIFEASWMSVPRMKDALITFHEAEIDIDDPDIQKLLKNTRVDWIATNLLALKKAGIEDKQVGLWVSKYSNIFSENSENCATQIALILNENNSLNNEHELFKTEYPSYRLRALHAALKKLQETKIKDKQIFKTLVETSLANLGSAPYEEQVAEFLIAVQQANYISVENLRAVSQSPLWAKQYSAVMMLALNTLTSHKVDSEWHCEQLFGMVVTNPYVVKPVLETLLQYQQRRNFWDIFGSVLNFVKDMKLESNSLTKEELQGKLLTSAAQKFNISRPHNFYSWFVETASDKRTFSSSKPDGEKSECRII